MTTITKEVLLVPNAPPGTFFFRFKAVIDPPWDGVSEMYFRSPEDIEHYAKATGSRLSLRY